MAARTAPGTHPPATSPNTTPAPCPLPPTPEPSKDPLFDDLTAKLVRCWAPRLGLACGGAGRAATVADRAWAALATGSRLRGRPQLADLSAGARLLHNFPNPWAGRGMAQAALAPGTRLHRQLRAPVSALSHPFFRSFRPFPPPPRPRPPLSSRPFRPFPFPPLSARSSLSALSHPPPPPPPPPFLSQDEIKAKAGAAHDHTNATKATLVAKVQAVKDRLEDALEAATARPRKEYHVAFSGSGSLAVFQLGVSAALEEYRVYTEV